MLFEDCETKHFTLPILETVPLKEPEGETWWMVPAHAC